MTDDERNPNAPEENSADAPPEEPTETVEPEGGDDPKPSGKTYTESEINAIIDARVARARKQARKEAERELEEKRKREALEGEDRWKAEVDDREKRIAELEQANRNARIREQLAGKVVNVDDAVRALGDDFLDDETLEVDVDGFLKAKPYFRAQPNGPASGANPASPPEPKRLTREQIARMTEKEIEDRYDEVREVLGG